MIGQRFVQEKLAVISAYPFLNVLLQRFRNRDHFLEQTPGVNISLAGRILDPAWQRHHTIVCRKSTGRKRVLSDEFADADQSSPTANKTVIIGNLCQPCCSELEIYIHAEGPRSCLHETSI